VFQSQPQCEGSGCSGSLCRGGSAGSLEGYGGRRVKRQYRSGFTSLLAFLRLLHHLKSAPLPLPYSLWRQDG